jgi:arylsulfatase A-like enzyme
MPAALSYAHNQMGRILGAIQDLGELDNTLVIYIQGDNGASAEGGQQGLLNEMAFSMLYRKTLSRSWRAWMIWAVRSRSTTIP